MENRSWIWRLVLILSSFVVMNECSKYSENVNIRAPPPAPPLGRTFRMSRLNVLWEKAQKVGYADVVSEVTVICIIIFHVLTIVLYTKFSAVTESRSVI